ncbi:MAG: universal stress protein [Gammaproteobacteria bacterium]|uniref:Nucleotide-binding universal stress UspA family protein n=1 Tax=Tolumonas osonensis TaxID=675874 RepID=A0A841GNG3_9GAMM|nr:universal stress protein [Tolumonas osonensis]MBB6055013.1 nucleotide-binding universal stress UspA family protein [Tolumonas osonensis]NCB59712.1 universal stress protein [Gammaproteobacteria bacterium]
MRSFKNILYVFEPSIAQETNIIRAVSLAHSNQAHLAIIDVIPEQTVGSISTDLTEALISKRWNMLESLISSYTNVHDVDIEVRVGTKFLEVIRAVLRNNYDLVIKGAENPDWMMHLFGSDDMHLLRKCPCPIWLMKPQEKANYDCIVAAFDFDPDDQNQSLLNQQILDLANSLALSEFAELHLVHAWDVPEIEFVRGWINEPDTTTIREIDAERARHQAGMDALIKKLRDRLGAEAYSYLSPQVHLPMGSARKTIPALLKAVRADLIVMGTIARTGIPGFIIGNTAEAILDQLECSVLAVKPAGFVTPVTLLC